MVKITHSESKNIPNDELARETEIVWVYDRSRFPFVREIPAPQSSARWPTRCPDDRIIVGYAVQRKRSGATYFRQFYVMRRDGTGKFILPSEAVDPLTVEIGVPGCKTERCRETMTPNDKRYIARIFAKKNAPKKEKKRVNSPNKT